jgi:hypothetical protein
MNKEQIARTTSLFAFGAILFCCAPARAEGVLAATSGATVDAGFPVITGPATNVLAPTGTYTTDPAPRMKIPDDAPVAQPPKLQVKNYSWPKAGTRLARGASHTRTTTSISMREYNTVDIRPVR